MTGTKHRTLPGTRRDTPTPTTARLAPPVIAADHRHHLGSAVDRCSAITTDLPASARFRMSPEQSAVNECMRIRFAWVQSNKTA